MVAQNAILLILPVKFNFCRKTSAAKFLCVKTSRGRVVATSFPYLTVHIPFVGDVPIYLKSVLKVTCPSENAYYDLVRAEPPFICTRISHMHQTKPRKGACYRQWHKVIVYQVRHDVGHCIKSGSCSLSSLN